MALRRDIDRAIAAATQAPEPAGRDRIAADLERRAQLNSLIREQAADDARDHLRRMPTPGSGRRDRHREF
jgi:hypothetical protein